MRIHQSQLVKAPGERVFQTWTDYQAWPRFPFSSRVKVTERVGSTAVSSLVFGLETSILVIALPTSKPPSAKPSGLRWL